MSATDKTLIAVFGCLALTMIGLAVVGAFRYYSPVPYWDMWSALKDYFELKQGHYSIWWAQHNEHRIVLSRLLFWAYYRWFDGIGYYLIAVNFLLAGIIAGLFWSIIDAITGKGKADVNIIVLRLFSCSWLFSWAQRENLTWSFQSQFFLAYLLPLGAFYCLYKSVAHPHTHRHFVMACVLGLASVGTMANGIIVLPLMTLYSLLLRQRTARLISLTLLSAFALYGFFYDYQAPTHQNYLIKDLRDNPLGVIQYVCYYLGCPFYYFLGENAAGKFLAALAGLMLVGTSIVCTVKTLPHKQEEALKVALLFFILYIGGTALATAGGRLHLGVDQAFASRYATPSLMAWTALLALNARVILSAAKTHRVTTLTPLLVIAVLMVSYQFKALETPYSVKFEKNIGALVFELGVNDKQQIESHVYPYYDFIKPVINKAIRLNLSVFGIYPFRDAREQLGTTFPHPESPVCLGKVETVEAIDSVLNFFRIDGWLYMPSRSASPAVIRFLDTSDKVVGFAFTGQARPDIGDSVDKNAVLSGFRGYVSNDRVIEKGLTLAGEKPACQLQVDTIQPPPFLYTTIEPRANLATVDSGKVLPGHRWQGADYYKSVIPGMKVYGSFIHSDADTGSIAFRAKPGDRIYYRSGPKQNRQIMEIFNHERVFSKRTMPVSKDWLLLQFSERGLPDEGFTVKFSDNGSGWGEWSAIALLETTLEDNQK